MSSLMTTFLQNPTKKLYKEEDFVLLIKFLQHLCLNKGNLYANHTNPMCLLKSAFFDSYLPTVMTNSTPRQDFPHA